MELKLNVNKAEPVIAEATAVIHQGQHRVFDFIAGHFYENYPRWMTDVTELECLDPLPVRKGTRLRQVRVENDDAVPSVFEVREFEAYDTLSFEGLDLPYRQIYRIDPAGDSSSRLTFRFELLEVELFMRPFVKLIRRAMVEGVENTLETLAGLLNPSPLSKT